MLSQHFCGSLASIDMTWNLKKKAKCLTFAELTRAKGQTKACPFESKGKKIIFLFFHGVCKGVLGLFKLWKVLALQWRQKKLLLHTRGGEAELRLRIWGCSSHHSYLCADTHFCFRLRRTKKERKKERKRSFDLHDSEKKKAIFLFVPRWKEKWVNSDGKSKRNRCCRTEPRTDGSGCLAGRLESLPAIWYVFNSDLRNLSTIKLQLMVLI